MVSNTRWSLIDYQHSWVGNTKHLVLTTDRSCHLWMRITRRYPYKRSRWVVFRGVALPHSDAINFVIRSAIEQEEAGDTLVHTFDFPGWEVCDQYYWYFSGFIADISSDSNTCIFTQHYTGELEPEPPVPTADPICWNIPARLLRCGNRYTFWANNTWYALVPTTTSLTMWKLVVDTFMQMDPGNEPYPDHGVIVDADARKGTLWDRIFIAYVSKVPNPGPNELYHVIYSTTLDQWLVHERVCDPIYSFFAQLHVSLALDADLVPHIAYTNYAPMFPEVHYRNKIGGVWSAPELAIKVANKIIAYQSCWIDPENDAFHVTAVANTNEHWYNRRVPAPPAWDGNTQMGTNVNLGYQSIMAGNEIPHVAGISTTWKADHYEDQPPVTNQQDLTAVTSTCANMIDPKDQGGALAIVFRNLAAFIGQVYRPPLMPWLPETSPGGADVQVLTANYNVPDVISCLYQQSGAQATCFFAYWAPWH